MMNDPKPGSREATQQGCTCPVMDNCHGRGRYGNGAKCGWFVNATCQLHAGKR